MHLIITKVMLALFRKPKSRIERLFKIQIPHFIKKIKIKVICRRNKNQIWINYASLKGSLSQGPNQITKVLKI